MDWNSWRWACLYEWGRNLCDCDRVCDCVFGRKLGDMCASCVENPVNTIFLDCQHCVLCHTCAENIKYCPKCEQVVERVVRTYAM